MDRNLYKIQNRVNAGFDKFGLSKEEKYKIAPSEVNYEELQKEIARLVRLTEKESWLLIGVAIWFFVLEKMLP